MIFRDSILHNFWWKLLSLLLAGLTWLTIEMAFRKDEARRESPVITTSTRTFPAIGVTLLSSPTNTNRFKVTPTAVAVEVSGGANDLLRLQQEDVKAFVDITDAGDQKEFRRPIQTQVPPDCKVAALSRTNVSVERIVVAKPPEAGKLKAD
jgi:YbbR domain-containing protein